MSTTEEDRPAGSTEEEAEERVTVDVNEHDQTEMRSQDAKKRERKSKRVAKAENPTKVTQQKNGQASIRFGRLSVI